MDNFRKVYTIDYFTFYNNNDKILVYIIIVKGLLRMVENHSFIYALEERIGQPRLFVGRNEELEFLHKWLEDIPRKLSHSTAILSRRKKGKTALVERFYNIVFNQQGRVVPFYFEVVEGKKWLVSFAKDFYINFIIQYIAFKLKNPEILKKAYVLTELKELASKYNFSSIVDDVESFIKVNQTHEDVDAIWRYAQTAPHRIARLNNDFILQIIDEFQFLNSEICRDKDTSIVIKDLAGSYLSLAESKLAPLLVTGSWVGWLKRIIRGQLPARFEEFELGNFKEEEGLEAIYNYSIITGVEVADEVAVYLNKLVDSDPFYISAIIRSKYREKDLTTIKGLLNTIEYEVRKGNIYKTWMEYILNTIDNVNDRHGKKIVLFLSQNREKEWTRQEIINICDLPNNERDVENKLRLLVRGDLISEGSSSFRYKGMSDDIFYKLFRYKYEEEIENFPIEKIEKEEKQKEKTEIKKLKKKLKTFTGKEKYYKGRFLEYVILKYLRFGRFRDDDLDIKDVVVNYQEGAKFTDYQEVKSYKFRLEGGREHEIDVWAQSREDGQSIYLEVKNWQEPVDKKEVEKFVNVVKDLRFSGYNGYFIYYALNGFKKEAQRLLKENGIMYSEWEKWKFEIYR